MKHMSKSIIKGYNEFYFLFFQRHMISIIHVCYNFFFLCKTFQNGRPISLILNLEETSIGKTSSPSIIFNTQGVVRPK